MDATTKNLEHFQLTFLCDMIKRLGLFVCIWEGMCWVVLVASIQVSPSWYLQNFKIGSHRCTNVTWLFLLPLTVYNDMGLYSCPMIHTHTLGKCNWNSGDVSVGDPICVTWWWCFGFCLCLFVPKWEWFFDAINLENWMIKA